jgi:hypothetical protein
VAGVLIQVWPKRRGFVEFLDAGNYQKKRQNSLFLSKKWPFLVIFDVFLGFFKNQRKLMLRVAHNTFERLAPGIN